MMSKRALLLIDLQVDFVEGGALAVPNGSEVIEVANRLIPCFDLVIATLDFHPADHKSFASQNHGVGVYGEFELEGLPQTAWPDHCIAGSHGAELVRGLEAEGIDHRIYKGTDRSIDSYSGFYDNGHRKGTGLAELLRAQEVREVVILGLATDYCVLYTALDSISEGFSTVVVTDGCRGVGLRPTDIPAAWARMERAGVRLAKSDEFNRVS
jgi:nicotinamidase/pyrazinamidase